MPLTDKGKEIMANLKSKAGVSCPVCGKEITRKGRKHCSKECARNSFGWKRGLVLTAKFVPCPVCGKKFKKIPSSHRVTCSHECSTIKKTKEKKHHKCPVCNKIFEEGPNKKKKCCSRKCGAVMRFKNHIYKVKPHHIIPMSDFTKCEICGYNKIPEILERHHIDRDHNNNVRKNLLVLCPNCHDEIHFKSKTGRFKWKSFIKAKNKKKNIFKTETPLEVRVCH